MNRPCPNVSNCPGTDDPITNYSSEAPDTLDFLSFFWKGNPTGGGMPTQQPWTLTWCGGSVQVATTAFDAEFQAILSAIQCDYDNGGNPPGIPNEEQVCCVPRPGGTVCFTVRAGALVQTNQVSANQLAHALACYGGYRSGLSLSAISSDACLGQFYGDLIGTDGAFAPVFIDVVSGTIPPGITIDDVGGGTLAVKGTPTTPGLYTFTVSSTDALGTRVSRTYSISVLGVTNLAAINPTLFAPFSLLLTAAGGTGPYIFSIASGALPTGLALSADGLLSGTATVGGTYTSGIKVTDASGITCTFPTTITPASVGFRICNWGLVGPTINTASWPASANPAWNGVFNLKTTDSFGNTIWYFINQSVNGKKGAASDAPDYPAGPWKDVDCFVELIYTVASGVWEVIFSEPNCANPDYFAYAMTNHNPADPSGFYVGPDGISVIEIRAPSSPCCSAALLTVLDWTKVQWVVPGTNGFATIAFAGNAFSVDLTSNPFVTANVGTIFGSCGQGTLDYCGGAQTAKVTVNYSAFTPAEGMTGQWTIQQIFGFGGPAPVTLATFDATTFPFPGTTTLNFTVQDTGVFGSQIVISPPFCNWATLPKHANPPDHLTWAATLANV